MKRENDKKESVGSSKRQKMTSNEKESVDFERDLYKDLNLENISPKSKVDDFNDKDVKTFLTDLFRKKNTTFAENSEEQLFKRDPEFLEITDFETKPVKVLTKKFSTKRKSNTRRKSKTTSRRKSKNSIRKSKTVSRRKSKSVRRKSKTASRRKSNSVRRKSKNSIRKSKTASRRKSKSVRRKYTIDDKYFKGNLKIFSKDYCGYCKDLKKMLETDLGLKFEEISQDQAEKYRLHCDELKNSKPFATVPQLFSIFKEKNKEIIFYLGEHNDTQKIIENLKKSKNLNL